jgi:hypothetical protein
MRAGVLSVGSVACWGAGAPLLGDGDRADVGGKRESRRADTLPGED